MIILYLLVFNFQNNTGFSCWVYTPYTELSYTFLIIIFLLIIYILSLSSICGYPGHGKNSWGSTYMESLLEA